MITARQVPAPAEESATGPKLVSESVAKPAPEPVHLAESEPRKDQQQPAPQPQRFRVETASLTPADQAPEVPQPQATEKKPVPAGSIELSNGNGLTGMAARSAQYLRFCGFTISRLTNAANFRFAKSTIYYRNGYLQLAKELDKILPGTQNLEEVEALGRPSLVVRVLLGRDLVHERFPQQYAQDMKIKSSADQPLVSTDDIHGKKAPSF